METLKAGCLAYLDTFAGLVGCRVLEVTHDPDTPANPMFRLSKGGVDFNILARVRLTETVGAYREGEILTTRACDTIPAGSIKVSEYRSTIRPYKVQMG